MAMTLDEARTVVATSSLPQREDFFPHAAWVRWYRAADADGQGKLVDAMSMLILEGDEGETARAANFFSNIGPSPELLLRLAREYVARGWDSSHPAASLIGDSWPLVREEYAALLEPPFLADPARHVLVGHAVLAHHREGAAWDALARMIAQTNEVELLEAAFEAAYAAKRKGDFHELMRAKPEPVIRALAATVANGREMLAACLIPPGPSLDRAALAVRLAAGKDCLVEPTFGSLTPGDRYALFVDGPDVKVVHYDPGKERVRSLERHPRKDLGAVLAEVTGVVVPETRLAALDRRADPLFAALAFRERRGAEIGQRLKDGSRWLPLGGSAAAECFLRHGAIGWSLADLEGGQPVYGTILGEGYLNAILSQAIYERPERDPAPVPADLLRRWQAADALVAASLRRLRAGEVAVRWGGAGEVGPGWARPDSPQVVTGLDGALWEVELTPGRPRGVKPLGEQWDWKLGNALLGLAVRGMLPERLVELAPGTRPHID